MVWVCEGKSIKTVILRTSGLSCEVVEHSPYIIVINGSKSSNQGRNNFLSIVKMLKLIATASSLLKTGVLA